MLKKLILLSLVFVSSVTFSATNDDLSESLEGAKSKLEAVRMIVNKGKPLSLYNFIKEEQVTIEKPANLLAIEGGEFVPQIDMYMDIYISFLDKGLMPYEALIMTYSSPESIKFIKAAKEKKEKGSSEK